MICQRFCNRVLLLLNDELNTYFKTFVSLSQPHSGQRDKPFVRDDEHDVRTPRPDLFDRPYPQEFGGETLRKVIFVI